MSITNRITRRAFLISDPAVAEAICEVNEDVGPMKFTAVVTDNANVMQTSWKIIEERYPYIAAHGCAAHGVNLLIKDIVTLQLPRMH